VVKGQRELVLSQAKIAGLGQARGAGEAEEAGGEKKFLFSRVFPAKFAWRTTSKIPHYPPFQGGL